MIIRIRYRWFVSGMFSVFRCHVVPGFCSRLQKQYRRSEVHLGELLDGVCEKMDDYAQGHWKDTGVKDLLPIIVNGAMNPRMSEFELLKDSNLNKGIKDYVSRDFITVLYFILNIVYSIYPIHFICLVANQYV